MPIETDEMVALIEEILNEGRAVDAQERFLFGTLGEEAIGKIASGTVTFFEYTLKRKQKESGILVLGAQDIMPPVIAISLSMLELGWRLRELVLQKEAMQPTKLED